MKGFLKSLLLPVLLLLAPVLFTLHTAAEEPEAAQPMTRLYMPYTGEHLYTADENEVRVLTTQSGWIWEGVSWEAPAVSGTPVWRMFRTDTGEHFYTADPVERAHLLTSDVWQEEGICWYSDEAGRCPVYRLFLPSAPPAACHHYTTDANERTVLLANGWIDEGIAWYGIAPGLRAPAPAGGPRWFLFGDSYTELGAGYGAAFPLRLAEEMGSALNFRGQSGMRYSAKPKHGCWSFEEMLDTWLPGIEEKETYTDILIELGINDVDDMDEAEIRRAFVSCTNRIRQAFPNARIHAGLFAKLMDDNYYEPRVRLVALLAQLSADYGCHWVPGNENVFGTKNQMADGLHPTIEAYETLYASVKNYMNFGFAIPYRAPEISHSAFGLTFTEGYDAGTYTLRVDGALPLTALEGPVTALGAVELPYGYRNLFLDLELQSGDWRIPVTMIIRPRVRHIDKPESIMADVFLLAEDPAVWGLWVQGTMALQTAAEA